MNSSFDYRKAFILNTLAASKRVSVNKLAETLDVTPETIRRDLSALEKQKQLLRVHGGAICYENPVTEPLFVRKTNIKKKEKRRIGTFAAKIIKNGDTVVLDSGTTTLALCECLQQVSEVTFLTHSLAAALCLNKKIEQKQLINCQLIVLGGTVYPEQRSIKGTLTERMLASFKVNKAFISCGGINEQVISDYDLEECQISSMMIEAADESYLLTDATKLGKQNFCTIKPTSSIDHIICDAEPDERWKKFCEDERIFWHRV